ncbi:dipeptide/oligopeptide/nickel ABC transporter permease/ATP-binding protein [Streptomyces sp. NPDC005827]|uniref:dipeptide/oligopeptide/nickel ABC transporter permease/ATP-binding protein n=1 Tax=Streptomyces sp. NPDC005827 TaxID=3157070 RepID=UPI0033E6CE3B
MGRRLLKNPMAAASLGFVILLVVVAVVAPWLVPINPDRSHAADILREPGGPYLLGTDGSGRDILSRLLMGTRTSLAGSAVVVATASVLGVTAGLLAGYYGRWIEAGASWVANVFMAMPSMVVLLTARTVVGPSPWSLMVVLGVIIAPVFYRVVYGAVTPVRHELYVDAAWVAGLSDRRIIARHILSVVRAPAIILTAGAAGGAIAIQAALDFLGLGSEAAPSWGGMLGDSFNNVYTRPLAVLWPSLAIALTCIALTLLANALRDELQGGGAGTKPSRAKAATPAVPRPGEPPATHQDGTEPAETLLQVRDLCVGYDGPGTTVKYVVDNVSLTVRRGEVHGLVGESGSGKTQTAFAVLGLLPPGGRVIGGSMSFDGTELTGLSERELRQMRGKRIAYIPQEPMSNLDPSFTVGSQLTEPLRVRMGLSKATARQRALKLLDRVGISDPELTYRSYPFQISGGMAQRVLIAAAVAGQPDLLIADEPTTALDVTIQAEVLDVLRDLQRESGMAVLLVTHNLGVVADLCDRVSVMQQGRIVETGPVRPLFAAPRHPYTKSLFDAVLEEPEPARPDADTERTPL